MSDAQSVVERELHRAAVLLARGVRGPEAVRSLLEQLGADLEAARVAFTVTGSQPASSVWGAPADGEPLDVSVDLGEDTVASVRLWGVVLDETAHASLSLLAPLLAALAGPAPFEGSDIDRWLHRHLDSIPVVTYMEYPDDDHPLGFAEVYVSAQIEPMLGYTPREWVEDDDADRWNETIHPDDRDRYHEEIERSARSGDDYAVEYRMRHKRTGEWIWVRDSARLVRVEGDAHPYWHGAMIDITRRKVLEERIAYLAYHDSLTGLANRKRFEEALQLALARARRTSASVAVLFMDLNNFKRVNDTFGHDMGDLLLEQVAERLRSTVRETDLVARQGGDEFLVLLADLDPRDESGQYPIGLSRASSIAAELAGRIDEALGQPFNLGGDRAQTGASIGISVFPDDAQDARALLKNADVAMYAVKHSRRRRGYVIATKQMPAEPVEADAI